jgi:hypothetical protein
MSEIFVDNIKHQSSQGSGTITLGASGESVTVPNGALTGQNYPAFRVTLDDDITLSDNTHTIVPFNRVVLDTNSGYSTTDDRYTVPTGGAGKYFIGWRLIGNCQTNNTMNYIDTYLSLNGTNVSYQIFHATGNPLLQMSVTPSTILDLVEGDYIQISVRIDKTSGSPLLRGHPTIDESIFYAYRIGA